MVMIESFILKAVEINRDNIYVKFDKTRYSSFTKSCCSRI